MSLLTKIIYISFKIVFNTLLVEDILEMIFVKRQALGMSNVMKLFKSLLLFLPLVAILIRCRVF